MTGFEPATPRTPCVCATRLRHIPKIIIEKSVGVAGFEPATSCSQSRRDNRATLYPEKLTHKNRKLLDPINKTKVLFAERKGFEPPVPVKAQLLSREPRSTTLAPLQNLKIIKNFCKSMQSYFPANKFCLIFYIIFVM